MERVIENRWYKKRTVKQDKMIPEWKARVSVNRNRRENFDEDRSRTYQLDIRKVPA